MKSAAAAFGGACELVCRQTIYGTQSLAVIFQNYIYCICYDVRQYRYSLPALGTKKRSNIHNLVKNDQASSITEQLCQLLAEQPILY